MNLLDFQSLPAQARILVSLAVLLDGFEAPTYLGNDYDNTLQLDRFAIDLAKLNADFRMPLIASLLRAAIREVK